MRFHLYIPLGFILISLFFYGCAASYQRPFITIFDQNKIELGASTDQIQKALGYPTEVYFENNNTKIMVYNIKQPITEKRFGNFESILNGSLNITEENAKWLNADEPYQCGFLFQNGKLTSYGRLEFLVNTLNNVMDSQNN